MSDRAERTGRDVKKAFDLIGAAIEPAAREKTAEIKAQLTNGEVVRIGVFESTALTEIVKDCLQQGTSFDQSGLHPAYEPLFRALNASNWQEQMRALASITPTNELNKFDLQAFGGWYLKRLKESLSETEMAELNTLLTELKNSVAQPPAETVVEQPIVEAVKEPAKMSFQDIFIEYGKRGWAMPVKMPGETEEDYLQNLADRLKPFDKDRFQNS